MSSKWATVRHTVELKYPDESQHMNISTTPVDDYVICPFNARTFPKKNYWVDQLGRHWVMEGNPGIWNVKLPHPNVDFPDVGDIVELTFKTTGILLVCVVESIYMQTTSVIGHTASRSCAKTTLGLNEFFIS